MQGEARIRITGIGKAVPDRIVPNEELAARLGVDPEWIESRTGIKTRRFAEPGESASTFALAAAREALERSSLRAEDLDLIVVGTSTPDHYFPSTAALLQRDLGTRTIAALDVEAACSGFLYALAVGSGFAATGAGRRMLVVGVEILSHHTNLDDPVTAPLFGDGAGAVVAEWDDQAEPLRFELGADGAGAEHVYIAAGGSKLPATPETYEEGLHFITMHGRQVYRSAVRTMTALGESLAGEGFDLVIAHQANRRILEEFAVNLGIDLSRVFMNIDRYGNTSAASIPIAICEAWETGRLAPGDRLLLLAFGAGYTWGGAALRWTLPRPEPAARPEARPEPAQEYEEARLGAPPAVNPAS